MNLFVVAIDPIEHPFARIKFHAASHVVTREKRLSRRAVEIRAEDRTDIGTAKIAPINFSSRDIEVHEVRSARRGVADYVDDRCTIERRALDAIARLVAPIKEAVVQ